MSRKITKAADAPDPASDRSHCEQCGAVLPDLPPLPWSVTVPSGGSVRDHDGNVIAVLHRHNNRRPANLMAAAPEMFCALQRCIEEIEEGGECSTTTALMARKAIAKAEGKP